MSTNVICASLQDFFVYIQPLHWSFSSLLILKDFLVNWSKKNYQTVKTSMIQTNIDYLTRITLEFSDCAKKWRKSQIDPSHTKAAIKV